MMDAVDLLLSFCNLEFLVIGCKTQFSAAAKIRAFLCSGATYDLFWECVIFRVSFHGIFYRVIHCAASLELKFNTSC